MQLRNLKALIHEDDAVSPVIGVVLMVAITVILAAVIGAFVIGLGSETSATPQASFDFEYESGPAVTITHDGGDTIDAEYLTLKDSDTTTDLSHSKTSDLSAGDTLVSSASVESTETIRIVYESPNSDKSSVLATSTVP